MTDAAFLSSALAGPERRLRPSWKAMAWSRMRAQARGIRATREAGTSPAVLTGEAGSPCVRAQGGGACSLPQSSFSMSIRAWSSRR